MRLEKLTEALVAVTKRFDIDAIDLLLLSEIVTMRKLQGEGTIMKVVAASKLASPATVHARIKKLVARKLLVKIPDDTNLRYKQLETGPAFETLTKLLSEV